MNVEEIDQLLAVLRKHGVLECEHEGTKLKLGLVQAEAETGLSFQALTGIDPQGPPEQQRLAAEVVQFAVVRSSELEAEGDLYPDG